MRDGVGVLLATSRQPRLVRLELGFERGHRLSDAAPGVLIPGLVARDRHRRIP